MNEDSDAPLTDTALGPAADATTNLPDAIRNVETPLAWEQADDDNDDDDVPPTGEEALERLPDPYELDEPQSWGWAWGYAAVFLSVALVVALVVAAVGWAVTRREDHQTTPAAPPESSFTIPSGAESSPSTSSVSSRPSPSVAQAAPATTTVTAQAAPSQTPNPDAADNTYISIIEAAGIHLYDRGKAISVGRTDICGVLTTGKDLAGQSEQELADSAASAYVSVQSEFPALTEAQAKTVERAAVAAYCPQFTDLIAVNGPAADQHYLQELAHFNIPVTDPARAIAAGHWVCDQLTSGTTQADVVGEMMGQNVIRETAIATVVAATGNYCPQFRKPLPTR